MRDKLSSVQHINRLKEQFFTIQKDFSEDAITDIAALQCNFCELNGEKKFLITQLSNLLLMSRIMSTFPTEYFEFSSVWENVSVQKRTINKLSEQLHFTEMRLPGKQAEYWFSGQYLC